MRESSYQKLKRQRDAYSHVFGKEVFAFLDEPITTLRESKIKYLAEQLRFWRYRTTRSKNKPKDL